MQDLLPVLPLASRSSRLLGQLVDGMVGLAPIILAVIISTFSDALGWLLLMAGFAWSLFYYLFADGLPGGQSFAKRWLGMKVLDADTRRPCSFGQSFVRNLLLAILGPIDWIFIFGPRHQRLGDKAAGTVVVSD